MRTVARTLMMQRSASFSECRTYRYSLERRWDIGPPLVVIGLNPSTADETIDDPTIRRCIGFAKREGLGGLTMLNLFAFRATDPKAMKAAADPVGPRGDIALLNGCDGAGRVIAAWGHHGRFRNRDRAVERLLRGITLECLGTTKAGDPRHPLYLRGDAPLVAWKGIP